MATYNVRDLGALGDGAADDTAAFAAALMAASASGGIVDVPEGCYLVMGLAADWGADDRRAVHLRGASRATTIIRHGGGGLLLDCDRCHGLTVSDLTLAAGASTSTAVLRIAGTFRWRLQGLRIDGAAAAGDVAGIELRDSVGGSGGCYYGRAADCEVTAMPGAGWRLKTYNADGVPRVQANVFESCQAHNNAGDGWLLDHASGNLWLGGDAEANGGAGFRFNPPCAYTKVIGTYIENNSGGNLAIPVAAGLADLQMIELAPEGMQTGGPTAWGNLGRGSRVALPYDGSKSRIQQHLGPLGLWAITNGLMPGAAGYPAGNLLYNTTYQRLMANDGANWRALAAQRVVALADAPSIATDCSQGDYCVLSLGATGRTIANPTNALAGMQLTYEIGNASGGPVALNWGAAFRLDGSWSPPAAGKLRTITFRFNGSAWVQLGCSGDI